MSTYPNAIPDLTNPLATNTTVNPSHATQHKNANDEIEAICTELGLNPKGTSLDVKTRIDELEALYTGSTTSAHPVGGPYVTYKTYVNREPWDSVNGPVGQNPPLLVENYNTGYGLQIRNYCNDPVGGTGAGLQVVVMGDNISNGIYVVNQSTTAIQYGINVDNNSSAGYGLQVYNISTGTGINISNWDTSSTGVGIGILNCVNNPNGNATDPAAFKGINIYNVLANGGYGMYILNKSTSTGGSGIEIYNGESGVGASTGLFLYNDITTGYGLKVEHKSGDGGVLVTSNATSAAMILAASGSSGHCLTLAQTGTGYDICGTSSTWLVTKAGYLYATNIKAVGSYYSANNSAGATTSFAVAKVGGGTRTLYFESGLYITYVDS